MVASIYYIKDILFIAITKLFLAIRKKHILALVFCLICASLSAFLDALTLVAIAIAVCFNFYAIYYRVASNSNDSEEEFEEFRGFLRNMIMHGAVGTIIGGAMTIVGEPQNLMIGTKMGWSFADYFKHCGVIAVPVTLAGFLLCPLLEIFRFPGFGYQLSDKIRRLIVDDYNKRARELFAAENKFKYSLQGVVAVCLILALAFHVAEVGLIGIAVIVTVSAFSGLTREHDFSEPFNNAMPFATLIVIFFAILAVVHDQHLVTPMIHWVLSFEGELQLLILYLVNGALSMVSDSVFVASVFITEVDDAYQTGAFSLDWYENLAVVVNMGTNIPSLGTPNGTAGFLFLLTSSLAPLIRLSYFRMLMLMLPYFIALSTIGGVMMFFFLR
jgi:NhaB family Na+:H+ antiporter